MSVDWFHGSLPVDFLPPELIQWWFRWGDKCTAQLTHPKIFKNSHVPTTSENFFVYPTHDFIMENLMNGRKSKTQSGSNGTSNQQSTPLEWINIPLSDEDLNILASDEKDFDTLAALLCNVASRGYGISIKRTNEGKSYSVTIYRPPTIDDRRNLGLSSSSSSLRDALLVTLYKLEVCLQGEIGHGLPNNGDMGLRQRFR